MNAPPDESDPYRAPEASLETPAEQQAGPVSDKAMQLLAATRWGMKVAAIALMANGVLTLAGGALLLAWSPATIPRPLSVALILVFATVLFLPGLRLLQSALAITRAQRTREERDIVAALQRHQQFWMLLGCMLLLIAALLYFVFGFMRAMLR